MRLNQRLRSFWKNLVWVAELTGLVIEGIVNVLGAIILAAIGLLLIFLFWGSLIVALLSQ